MAKTLTMQKIKTLIESQTQEFEQLPFFHFLQDKSIHPKQRLGWVPCLAPFAMIFGELNKDFLRVEPTEDNLQKLINKHTYQDDHHWKWFLQDLDKLEFNHTLKLSDTLKFLWSEELARTRKLAYDLLIISSRNRDPILKLVIVECIEATGHVAQVFMTKTSQELQEITQHEYRYFGDHHLKAETGHTIGIDPEYLANIEITEEQQSKAIEIVEQVFASFTEFTDGLLMYAQKQLQKQDLVNKLPIQAKNDFPFGNSVALI